MNILNEIKRAVIGKELTVKQGQETIKVTIVDCAVKIVEMGKVAVCLTLEDGMKPYYYVGEDIPIDSLYRRYN